MARSQDSWSLDFGIWNFFSHFGVKFQAGERSLRMFLKIPKKNTSGKGGDRIVFTPVPADWYTQLTLFYTN
jgi:hypothetical protein